MGIPVVPIPNWRVAGSGMVLEAVDDELDSGRGVCNKDKVKLFGISVEESKCSFPYGINAMSSYGRWGRCRVRIAVEIRNEVR